MYEDEEQSRFRPGWLEDLGTFYDARIARQFVLHFNLTDFVIDTSERSSQGRGESMRSGHVVGLAEGQVPCTVREYLHRFLFEEHHHQAIYTYSLAGGLVADDRPSSGQQSQYLESDVPQRKIAQRLLQDASKALHTKIRVRKQRGEPEDGQEVDLPDDIADNFKLLGHLLRQQHFASSQTAPYAAGRAETPIAVILDYAEKLIPYHLGEGQGDREQLQALEVVQRWALDPLIRRTKNIVILLTDNIGLIPATVYAEGSGCRAIRVPLPTAGEREAFIYHSMTQGRPRFASMEKSFGSDQREQARMLARVTQGMRLTDLDNLNRRVIVRYRKARSQNPNQVGSSGPLLTARDVQLSKAEVIEAQSASLLEIVPPVRGFQEIGGLENLKSYLRKRTQLMRRGSHSPLIPSGLLLAGPPGTGKTIIAEALARESGFNLVKMRNIQDKWIGSSERNLDMVLSLLRDLHPVIVFIDEIDQAMVRRDTGQSGDNGVGARMFARILEEMSDAENRGRILWVAATNRADIIDAALLRRFDRVVPLLTPDLHESCRIFATILDSLIKQGEDVSRVVYAADLQPTGKQDGSGDDVLTRFHDVARVTTEMGMTGAAIEIIVRRAIEMAHEEAVDQQAEQSPPVISFRHLLAALRDFKPNFRRVEYDFQSLLALQACNFHSVIPTLPETGIYAGIQDRETGLIDPDRLEKAIVQVKRRLESE